MPFRIHAVRTRWGEGDEEEKLRRAVASSLTLADQKGLKSISLPAISSGIFGFPKARWRGDTAEAADEFEQTHPNQA